MASDTSNQALVEILALKGQAECLQNGDQWVPLNIGTSIASGSAIRTGPNGSVDFLMQASRTSLRLPENSELHFDVLKAREAGEEIISDTRLRLVSGAIIGSQRKLSRPSLFEISTPDGKATITGTEYVVRADGAVSVLSGAVTVMYKEQGQGRPVRVTVQPGQSFDPATGQVVETTPDYLTDLIAEIDTVKNNAEHFNLDGAKVTVKAERLISPTVGNN